MTKQKNTGTSRNRTRSREELQEERRKIRSDLGAFKSVLSTPEGEEYEHLHFRWVNNVDNRIEYFQRLGWQLFDGYNVQVGDPNTAMEQNIAGESGATVPVGKGTIAHLMCIPKEEWAIDQEIKETEIRKMERSMDSKITQEGLDRFGAQTTNRNMQGR